MPNAHQEVATQSAGVSTRSNNTCDTANCCWLNERHNAVTSAFRHGEEECPSTQSSECAAEAVCVLGHGSEDKKEDAHEKCAQELVPETPTHTHVLVAQVRGHAAHGTGKKIEEPEERPSKARV